MSLVSELRVRLRGLFGRRAMDQEMEAELAYHIERDVEPRVGRGVPADEARRQARASFGGVDVAREGVRDERGVVWWDDLARDARHAIRALVRRPLYWFTAAVTLGLGIAATTAIFSIVSMVLLRPLPARDADALVVFGQETRQQGSPSPSISLPTIRDLRAQTELLEDVAAFANDEVGIQDDAQSASRVFWNHAVTGNYFTLLGLQPAVGRLFTQADEDRREPVLVLSYDIWKNRYGGDARVVGRSVLVNGVAFTIIGVAPEGWHGLESLVSAEGYLPLGLQEMIGSRTTAQVERRGADFLRAFGRVRAGKTVEDVRTGLEGLAGRIGAERGELPGGYSFLVEREVRARPVIVIAGMVPALAATFLGLAMLALLIACANVGNLVLSRTISRRGELAIRRALGASRGRVARELLVESAVVGLSALAVALPVAWVVITSLSNLSLAADVPLKIDVRLDRAVLAFSVLVAVGAGLIAGLAPALRGSAQDPGASMREGSGRTSAPREARRLGHLLLTGQLAFSLVLVIAGALFLRSLASVTSLDLGINPDRVVMASVDLGLTRYTPTRAADFFTRAVDGIGSLPGVEAVGLMRDAPMGFSSRFRSVEHLDRHSIGDRTSLSAQANTLSPGMFRALQMRLVEGRVFESADDSTAPRRVLVSDVFARTMWPEGRSVVGERFRIAGDSVPLEIIGVVQRIPSEFPTERPVPQFFRPYDQEPGLKQTLFVRTSTDLGVTMDGVRRVLRAIDPSAAVADLRPMHAFLNDGKAFFLYRIGSSMTLAIGILGLLQTLVGLYGVIAYAVGQRSREFGIRLALGAGKGQLIRQVMGPSLQLVALGVGVGLLGAALLMPAASTVLAVSPRDPLTYISCAAFLVGLATIALYLPARRAANAGAMRALRSD